MSEQQIRPKNPPVTITPNKFPGNSNMAKRLNPSESEPVEKPKVEPAPLKGSVTKRKKTFGERITSLIFSDTVSNVGRYILHDVLVPTIQNLLVDVIRGGSERMILGDRAPRRRYQGGSVQPGSYNPRVTPYDSYSVRPEDRYVQPRGQEPPIVRGRPNYDELVLDYEDDAQIILNKLQLLMDEYQRVTLADLYDICQITGEYTDLYWGWKNNADFDKQRLRDGRWLLIIPPPRSLR